MLNFSASDLEIMLEVARHWMKLRACHEIDNDLIMGAFFYQSWNPRATILKIEKQGASIGKIKRGGWALMPLRLAADFDPLALGDDSLSKVEIIQLSEMMAAAVSGGLKRFLMNGAVMQEMEGAKVSVYWSSVKAAKVVAEKLALAQYEIEQEQATKFNEANYA
jgi:hypothetical protein